VQYDLALVQTRDDLASFVSALRDDLLQHADEWENPTLDRFLDAFSAWCGDMPGFFDRIGEAVPTQPDWSLIARMFLAAAMYE
jgi:hypothetical protein